VPLRLIAARHHLVMTWLQRNKDVGRTWALPLGLLAVAISTVASIETSNGHVTAGGWTVLGLGGVLGCLAALIQVRSSSPVVLPLDPKLWRRRGDGEVERVLSFPMHGRTVPTVWVRMPTGEGGWEEDVLLDVHVNTSTGQIRLVMAEHCLSEGTVIIQ
jgi:hypothetical protein